MIPRCYLFNLGGGVPSHFLSSIPGTAYPLHPWWPSYRLWFWRYLLIFVCSYWSPGSVPLSSTLYYFLPSNSLEFNFFFSPQPLKVKLKSPILTLFWTHTPKSTQELCQCCVSWGPQTYMRPIFIIYSTEMFPHFPFTSLTHRLFQKCDARTFYQNLGTI